MRRFGEVRHLVFAGGRVVEVVTRAQRRRDECDERGDEEGNGAFHGLPLHMIRKRSRSRGCRGRSARRIS